MVISRAVASPSRPQGQAPGKLPIFFPIFTFSSHFSRFSLFLWLIFRNVCPLPPSGYGPGHLSNDVCTCLWGSSTSIYLTVYLVSHKRGYDKWSSYRKTRRYFHCSSRLQGHLLSRWQGNNTQWYTNNRGTNKINNTTKRYKYSLFLFISVISMNYCSIFLLKRVRYKWPHRIQQQ